MTIATDTEATGLFIHKGCQAFMVTACTDEGEIYLWKFPINPMTRKVTYTPSIVADIRKTFLKHQEVVFHNANFDLQVFNSMGLSWEWFFNNFDVHDTIVMSHAYKSSDKHGLKELCVQYCGYPDSDEHDLTTAVHAARRLAKKYEWAIADKNNLHETIEGTQREHFRTDYWVPAAIAKYVGYPSDHPWYTVCEKYAKKDAERTMVLFNFFNEVLQSTPNISLFNPHPKNTLYDKYNEARRLIYPLLDMQSTGIPVKPTALQDAHALYTQRSCESLEQLRRLSGRKDFNPRSPVQLQEVLFKKFRFKPVKQGASGPSADKEVISTLLSKAEVVNNTIADKYKFLVALKEYRKETTTLQYLQNYEVHSRNPSRTIQPCFSQTRTGTGRLSCTDPNTTNVGKKDMSNPFADAKGADKIRATIFTEILGIDTDTSFSLRNVFGPKRGEIWTCIDYDQFQLRIFAVVSESYDLIEGFERGDDIHSLVARTIFQKDDISDVERTAAKAINFGLLFGAGPEKIELLAGIPGLYRMFMANFPKAKIYLDRQSRLARSQGYVHTVGGYRLYVPRNAPHAASCYVIQGTEAEIVKMAMVRCHNYYTGENYPQDRNRVYRLMMMVHDELVFTSKKHDDISLKHIMQIMEQSGKDIGIPCKVDAKVTTTSWDKRESYVKTDTTIQKRRMPPRKQTI